MSRALQQLQWRNTLREVSLVGNVDVLPQSEAPEQVELIETMTEAYAQLADGIHSNVQAAAAGKVSPVRKVTTPVLYINGHVAKTSTEYRLGYGQKQPAFVTQYIDARDMVYAELFSYALQTSDYGPLLSTVCTFKESDLAKRCLQRLYEHKQSYPDMVAGNIRRAMEHIDTQRVQVDAIRHTSRLYAKREAKRQRNYELRRRLNNEGAGALGTLAIGCRLYLPVFGSRNELVEQPLRRIAALPSVIEQLIARERAGIPLSDAF